MLRSKQWITTELFTKLLFLDFVANVNASKANPRLLIIDGHSFDSRNIDVIDIALENGVNILVLQPHSTMQPVYRSFMKALKMYYGQECKLGGEIIREESLRCFQWLN